MKLLLKQNNADIRQQIGKAGINVCACASFYGAEWLDYDTAVPGSVHGVGYTDGTDCETPEEVREQYLRTSKNIHVCKDVEEFIGMIRISDEKTLTPEQFIKNCTKNCSNELSLLEAGCLYQYAEWLTPEQALKAVEIARQEQLRHKDKLNFTAIPHLLEMMIPTERTKDYVTKLADTLEREGYTLDARIVRNRIRMMEGEEVAMAVMDEERSVEEESKLVADRLLEEVFPQDGDFLTEDVFREIVEKIARHFVNWQKQRFETNRLKASDEMTREEYDREVNFVNDIVYRKLRRPTFSDAIEYGIGYQKEKMKKEAVTGTYDSDDETSWITFDGWVASSANVGEKVRIIILNEEDR